MTPNPMQRSAPNECFDYYQYLSACPLIMAVKPDESP